MDYILSIVILAGINMIAVLGLSIFTGFTGLFSLGHAAFVAVGAYTSAILTYYYYVDYYLALAAGAAAAGIVSLIIGVPTLRAKLRSDYFAIAVLGFGEALRVLLENLEITNGARGLPGIDNFTTLPVVLACLAGGVFVARNFLRSRWGAACIAIREDPIAAETAGVRLFRTRLLSLVVSAVYCGSREGCSRTFSLSSSRRCSRWCSRRSFSRRLSPGAWGASRGRWSPPSFSSRSQRRSELRRCGALWHTASFLCSSWSIGPRG